MSSRINIIKYVKNLSIFFFGLLVFYAVIGINVYQKFKYVQLQFCSSRSENRMDDLGVIKSSRFFFISGATDLQLKYIKLIRNDEVKRMVIKSLNKFTKEQLGKNEIVPNTHGDNWTSLCTRYPRFLQRPRILVRWTQLYQPCKDLEKKTEGKYNMCGVCQQRNHLLQSTDFFGQCLMLKNLKLIWYSSSSV